MKQVTAGGQHKDIYGYAFSQFVYSTTRQQQQKQEVKKSKHPLISKEHPNTILPNITIATNDTKVSKRAYTLCRRPTPQGTVVPLLMACNMPPRRTSIQGCIALRHRPVQQPCDTNLLLGCHPRVRLGLV